VAWPQHPYSRGGQLGIYVVNGSEKMKKIEAVIFPVHLNAVRVELEPHGIRSGLTLIEVRSSDGDQSLLPPGKRGSKKSQERVKLELIVEDSEAEKSVNIILRHARPQSDEEGGHIAVLEVNEILGFDPGQTSLAENGRTAEGARSWIFPLRPSISAVAWQGENSVAANLTTTN
jgi:nitrogen regulatory protein PII